MSLRDNTSLRDYEIRDKQLFFYYFRVFFLKHFLSDHAMSGASNDEGAVGRWGEDEEPSLLWACYVTEDIWKLLAGEGGDDGVDLLEIVQFLGLKY